MPHRTSTLALLGASLVCLIASLSGAAEPAPRPLTLIVMDPLAAPLSCPCVEGYAQRKYERLAEYLEQKLARKVELRFGESLEGALRGARQARVDLIIGKDSVVRADAQAAKFRIVPVASLTAKDGSTTQSGLFVVPAKDPAKKVGDLNGYRIIFGSAECAEKHAAALELLKSAGVKLPEKIETSSQCSDGATRILELGANVRGAAVISNYAKPLLEGCGTVPKGALRLIGETKPVPFVTAFVAEALPQPDRERLTTALLEVGKQPLLAMALESVLGFVPYALEQPPKTSGAAAGPPQAAEAAAEKPSAAPPATAGSAAWPGWRGPQRNGLCAWLPAKLPDKAVPAWSRPLGWPGLGGVAATEKYVVIGDRDLDNLCDVFRCFQAADGQPLWTVQYPALGKLDYGNTPRATPLIHDGLVYLLGAFGHLHCVRLDTGEIVWLKNLRLEFGDTTKQVWGSCSSPLIAAGKLIVNPGGPEASLVALEPKTGEVLWQTPGPAAGFGSLIAAEFSGVRQIVGHDRISLGGWDLATGKRLWKLVPPNDGDFNVPTPIQVEDKLLVATENNGTRLYAFDAGGRIIPQPVAQNADVAPDISTPVVINGRVYCVWKELHCLDLRNGLKTLWTGTDNAFSNHGAIVAHADRLLVIGAGGELILVDARSEQLRIISRLPVFTDGATEAYSHPALVGHRLYLRGESSLVCLEL